MSLFPNFSNIQPFIVEQMQKRKNPVEVSKLNCWVKVASGVQNGCILYGNPSLELFTAAGDNGAATVYGDKSQSGVIGVDWGGKPIAVEAGNPGRPMPIVTSVEVDEGAGNISRKANVVIRCFSVTQLELIMKYYMEPGFTLFLEWGWNNITGVRGLGGYDVPFVSSFQSIKAVNNRRVNTKGCSDVYLGFITGGSIATSETYWDVTVKATGFTELPAFLMAADNTILGDDASKQPDPVSDYFVSDFWGVGGSLPKKRWKMCFNELPSNKKTALVKSLESDKEYIVRAINFINFDTRIQEEINSKTEGSFFSSIFGDGNASLTVEGDAGSAKVELPEGTKLAQTERFIRFGALMKIMNKVAAKGYRIGNQQVIYAINTERTVCGGFDKMFSTDKSKLFIPNKNSAAPDFAEVAASAQAGGGGTPTTFSGTVDNSVTHDGKTVLFPRPEAINGGVAQGTFGQVKIHYVGDGAPGAQGMKKAASTWGFLDDLYVNFDFAKGILETKNFVIKDALYQILNGMSSAAGSMWDFQIMEVPTTAGSAGSMQLQVVDINCVSDDVKGPQIAKFDLSGPGSVFIDASFDMDIGGAMMNQIIGSRNSIAQGGSLKQNTSNPPIKGKLFSQESDLILTKIETEARAATKTLAKGEANQTPAEGQEATDEAKKEANKKFAQFFEKVCLVPKVEVEEGKWEDNPYSKNYMAAYNDQAIFEQLKIKGEVDAAAAGAGTSILLPIKFKFGIHGLSGFRRGDKFKINGIPKKFSEGGFFQVTSVKHTLSGMLWKTEIEGGFRQSLEK
jgi:hypothetical protein